MNGVWYLFSTTAIGLSSSTIKQGSRADLTIRVARTGKRSQHHHSAKMIVLPIRWSTGRPDRGTRALRVFGFVNGRKLT